MQLTFIGNGAMALAIAKGLPKEYTLEVVGRDEQKLKEFAAQTGASYALLNNFNIEGKDVVFAIKPHVLETVASQLQGKAETLYSVLAGVSLEKLHRIDAQKYIRVMPNVAAAYGASTTTITGDIESKQKALELFSSIGKVFWVEDEKQLDIATAIAGCGPAFLALVAEAMSDGAVKCGMKREIANELVASNFYSFAPLIEKEHPALIKDKITSPGGTTIEGIKALEQEGARYAFFKAIEKAYERLK